MQLAARLANEPAPAAWQWLRRLAGAGGVVCLIATGLNLALLARNWDTRTPGGFTSGPVEIVTAIAYAGIAGVGIAMVGRRPEHRAGWVFLLSGVILGMAAFASEYATYGVLTEPGSLPGVPVVAWAGAWGWWLGAGVGLTFGLMLYPTGSLPSPRWKLAAVAATVNLVVLTLLHALAPGPLDGEYSVVDNPFGAGSLSTLATLRDLAWVLVTLNGAVAIAALFRRASAAGPEERLQLYWLMVPAAAAAVAAPLWGIGSADGRLTSGLYAAVLVAVFGAPLVVASAMGRAARLRKSVQRLVLAREDERGRIRRDLHDGLGPTLAGMALQLDVARSLVRDDPATAEEVLQKLGGHVNGAIADVRRLVDDLRPPVLDDLGLLSAIREATSYLSRRNPSGGFDITVRTTGNLGRLPPATEITAFRIVMEAVTNAARHAEASHCVVHLALDGVLDVQVEDDGRGLAPDHLPGAGLCSMRDRAAEIGGTCAVEARAGGGTVVRASLPVVPS